MTRLRLEYDYDAEDRVRRVIDLDSERGQRFLVAWVNPFGLIEWSCTDELDPPDKAEFADLTALLHASSA